MSFLISAGEAAVRWVVHHHRRRHLPQCTRSPCRCSIHHLRRLRIIRIITRFTAVDRRRLPWGRRPLASPIRQVRRNDPDTTTSSSTTTTTTTAPWRNGYRHLVKCRSIPCRLHRRPAALPCPWEEQMLFSSTYNNNNNFINNSNEVPRRYRLRSFHRPTVIHRLPCRRAVTSRRSVLAEVAEVN